MINPYDCTHDRTVVRWRTRSNGVEACVMQCLCCGRELRTLSKTDPERVGNPQRVPFDEELRERINEAWKQHASGLIETRRQEYEDRRAIENAQWWEQYTAYLKTPEWRERRRLVLERDNYLCQACRNRKAVQAHHTTYQHLGYEPLWELVAICVPCHEALHQRDREKRDRAA